MGNDGTTEVAGIAGLAYERCKECSGPTPCHAAGCSSLVEVEQKPLTLVTKENRDLQAKQTEALTVLASATRQIADFLTGGGLNQLLSGYARSQAVKDILGGLAAHDGRNSLDARVLGQNALEITEAVEAVYKKYAERLAEKARDPEIHAPQEEYKPLRERDGD